ncbi:hypothetical protein FRACYDRAFT_251830 [Fragilariopsis cylindrus CCMP1102]|uniref:Uncharacterized protein n=1 Tax=Fragilariopsis cylindrus CCMP1102 TaxID=635003 RepID=A0A1E7EMH5_9STRA|nr:hypothetical protein FRACYDRAFT_251830 [Fragilariopsis cylindrus CCMP1102]|eukprot:OEU07101.1 hypothetical protein FRACYDRAFT_251830 [Fragilariopsis cylindrus CCMP1102]
MLLQRATNPDVALSNSWVQKTEAKRAHALPGAPVVVSYTEYLKFLMQQSKVHDLSTPFKRPTCHAHQAESFYNDNDNGVIDGEDDGTSDFIANMSISGETMSNEQTVLAFAAYQRNRPPPRPRDPEADINQAIYSKCSREFRIAWSKEPTDIKKQILKQNNNKSPKQGAKKNSELAVYMGQSEGYDTDTSAYSEATYGYDADDNDDQSVIEATELKDLPKKTDLPIADPRRMLSNRSTPLIGKDGNVTGHLTYTASMAVIRHRFDQVDSSQAVSTEENYVVSVYATKFFDEPLALMDGGANGGIAGSDMRVMSYNSDGRCVNIGIAGDHQMTGKKLGTFCSVIETRFGQPDPSSDEECVIRLKKRMAMNDIVAIDMASQWYHFGKYGLPKDPQMSFDLCLRAAKLGSSDADSRAAMHYKDGKIVPIDMTKAADYLKKAVKKGNIFDRHIIGADEWSKCNYRLGSRHWLLAAAAGCTDSLKQIATCYKLKLVTKKEYSVALASYGNELFPTILLLFDKSTSTATQPLRNIFRMIQWVEFKYDFDFDCRLCIIAFRPGSMNGRLFPRYHVIWVLHREWR